MCLEKKAHVLARHVICEQFPTHMCFGWIVLHCIPSFFHIFWFV